MPCAATTGCRAVFACGCSRCGASSCKTSARDSRTKTKASEISAQARKMDSKASVSQALLQQSLADGAGDPWFIGFNWADWCRGRPGGNFANELVSGCRDEGLRIFHRNDECARAADDAISIIGIEIVDIGISQAWRPDQER